MDTKVESRVFFNKMKDFDLRSILPSQFTRYTIPKSEFAFPWIEVYSALVASLSFFCTGVVQSYTSPAIYSLESDGDSNISLTRSDISWIASSPSLAAFVGTIFSAPLLEFCGRQKTLLFLTLPYIGGWFLISFASNVSMLHAGRAFTGLSIGLAKAAAPIYVSEISRPSLRGILGMLAPMMNALGILIGVWTGCIMEWRNLALAMSIFPLLLLLLSLWIPESPLWLLSQKEDDKAFKSLLKFRGQGRDLRVQEELDEIKSSMEQMNFSTSKLPWKDLIWRMENYLGFSLMIFQQFCGVSAVIYYLEMILSETTSGGQVPLSLKPETAALSVGIVHFACFFISLPLIDRIGRRVLLVASGVLMASSHAALAIFLYTNIDPRDTFANLTRSWLPIGALCTFIGAFSIGFGPVPYVVITEVFSVGKLRSYLCSMAALIAQLASFAVLQLFPILMTAIKPHFVFMIFSTVCICSVLFVIFLVPETKGKTLAEIEKYFRAPETLLERKTMGGENPSFENLDMPCVYVPITRQISPSLNGESYPCHPSAQFTQGSVVTRIYCKSPATLPLPIMH